MMRKLLHWCGVSVGSVLAAAAPAQELSLPGSPAEVAQFISEDRPHIALEDVTLIDGTGAPARAHQSIVISNGRITAVGPKGSVQIPSGAVRKRLSGRAVLPGLVMLHEHMMYFSGFRIWHAQPVSYPRLYLAAGVTTVRTAGSDFPYIDLNLKRGIDDGRMAGPHMFVTGPFFNGFEGHFVGDDIVDNEQGGRKEVAYWASHGATSFKLYTAISPAAARGVINEAHTRKLTVTGHLGRLTCREAAELGIDNIEHSFSACLPELGITRSSDGSLTGVVDATKAKALIDLFIAKGVVLTSTPSGAGERLSAEVRSYLNPTALKNYDEAFERGFPFVEVEPLVRSLEQKFIRAGGRMVIGSDPQDFGQVAGFANHRALELLAEAGLPPLRVLRMGTLDGARFLGIDNERGRIAVGKAADLVIVRGDPSRRISDIRNVEQVFKDGRGFDPIKLRESAKASVGWR